MSEILIAWIATAGILFTVVGAALVFRYGQPFQAVGGGAALAVSMPTDDHIRLMARYGKLAIIGLCFVILGSVLQVSAVWLTVIS